VESKAALFRIRATAVSIFRSYLELL